MKKRTTRRKWCKSLLRRWSYCSGFSSCITGVDRRNLFGFNDYRDDMNNGSFTISGSSREMFEFIEAELDEESDDNSSTPKESSEESVSV